MAYNYAAAYGTSYGQYTAQPSSFGAQQTSASGYGHYGQTASAYGTASSSATTSTTASSVSSHGYGATGTATTTAQSTYNFGYNYNYGADSSNAYNSANTLQAFQQSWYNNTSVSTTPTANQQTATTAQTTTQQQQYTYLQQYQQHLAAYQQYASAAAGKADNTQQQQQQHATPWTAYNQPQQQRQQQQPATTPGPAASVAKTGWGNYQQQGVHSQQNTGSNQQKPTNVVYRTPMKYPATNQYGTSSAAPNYPTNQQQQPFKSPSSNSNYGGSSQNYNQGYGNNNQSFGSNQNYGHQNTNQQQQYGGNQSMKNTSGPYNQNQGFQGGQNMGGNFNSQGYGNQPRGGFGGPNNNNNGPMGHMNMQGPQRGNIRPLLPQRSPMGGGGPGPGYGNMGPGPRDGPDIPPFPRAWHSQDQGNDFQRGFGEQKERWGPSSGRGGLNQQNRGMYNNNSRNPRGANRELWSPAQKSTVKQEKEKPAPVKKDEGEKVDKDKHPEIKSYLYAWLGARHTRPTYDIRQIGERPNIMFRCDLRVDKYSFVGVGKATNKKEAQTTAAWKFAEYLVKLGEIAEAELPSKQVATPPEEIEGDIGDVREEKEAVMEVVPQNKGKREIENRNRDKRGPGRGRGNRRGNPNWGPGPQVPELVGEIPPLMAIPVGPWGAPPPPPMGPPPPRLMGPPGPPPALMDFAPPFWDDGPWIRPPIAMGMGPPPPMGPPMHMRPPPPFMRRNQQNDFWRRRDIEERMMDLSRGQDWAHPEDMFISQMIRNQQEGERRQRGQRGMPPMESSPGEWEKVQQARPVITSDDRHVMSKHAEIYPQEGELKSLHRIVNTVEQALKLLSDKFVDEDHPKEDANKENTEKSAEESKKEEPSKKEKSEDGEKKQGESKEEEDEGEKKEEGDKKETEEKKDEKRAKIKILKRPKRTPKQVDTRPRVLCGVNRIGPLAKGLLITKDDHVELALLCGEIPTEKLLDRIMDHIEQKLCEVDEEFKLTIEKKLEEAGFLIKSLDEASPVQVMVILTATALKKQSDKKSDKKDTKDAKEGEKEEEEKKEEAVEEPDPVGMLPKRKMLDALACLRHTHWFQTKACGVQSCVILTRILRDLQRRDEKWSGLSEWALEVLIFNCLTSSEEQMSPGDACRRFFEVVAGGILLPDMPGIVDPSEKSEQRDVLDCLTTQQREDITQSAQTYLRHLAFRDIHIILGMEKLAQSSRSDNHPSHKSMSKEQDEKVDDKEKSAESNNQRKRRFEHNGSDSVAESPKRSLTDEEDTDTQQNLAELSISDEASEGRAAALDEETEGKEKLEDSELKEDDLAMETTETETELTKDEEDALLEDDKMDT